jgi:CBS domain-containing protein/sporulation protein YlmC with PRC-barrel domain
VNQVNTRVYAARLAGTEVFDPHGDSVGKVRDIVVTLRPGRAPLVLGLVLEVPPRRRIFLPMSRVTSIAPGQVISTGKLNMMRFRQRDTETLILAELVDRKVTQTADSTRVAISDAGMEWQQRTKEWHLTRLYVRKVLGGIRRYGEGSTLEWDEITEFGRGEENQQADNLIESFAELRAADLANALRNLPRDRQLDIARQLDDERLADVLEELPEDDRVAIVQNLGIDRAADVVEEMDPDDAADLLRELPVDQAQEIIGQLEPEDAEDIRRLLSYEDYTAGGMMTTEPVLLSADATVAEALARVRNPDISPSLAAQVYVVRSPIETPTGKYLGVAHFQRLLREPPSALVSSVIDKELEPVGPGASLSTVARYFATYNLVALPVVDEAGRLLGAVTVDDLVDHMLPENWRELGVDEEVAADGA